MPAHHTKSKADEVDNPSKHYCVDVGGKAAYDADLDHTFGSMQALALHSKIWPAFSNVAISFIGGTPKQRETVVNVVRTEFQPHINLVLSYQDHDGDIVVSFQKNKGAWSMLGRDAQNVKPGQATMNLGWLDDVPNDPKGGAFGVIKHEFGHGLAAWIHEHQIEGNGIEWNKEVVIAALSADPNYWDLQTIETNMFERYKRDSKETRALTFDPESIMHYAFPEDWVLNKDYNPRYNQHLSDQDKYYLRLMYPGKPTDLPRQLVGSEADFEEANNALLERSVNFGQKKKKKCTPTDTQVIVIALACVALMTMLGYFAGKSRGRSSARSLV